MKVKPRATLLRYTPAPEELVAMAGKICYSDADIESLRGDVAEADQAGYIRRVTARGHMSITEHASFTFGLEGVSRSVLAQITRHRIASFSVQSQRYVTLDGEGGFDYIIPPAIEALGEEAVREYDGQMRQIDGWYQLWRERLGGEHANEDARFVLPNACATRMLVTMNARELNHFFSLRTCFRAQWEIREAAWQMLELAYAAAPALFEKAGPPCAHGKCPEGSASCGRAAEVKARLTDIKNIHGSEE